jgi:hypothetical protein
VCGALPSGRVREAFLRQSVAPNGAAEQGETAGPAWTLGEAEELDATAAAEQVGIQASPAAWDATAVLAVILASPAVSVVSAV